MALIIGSSSLLAVSSFGIPSRESLRTPPSLRFKQPAACITLRIVHRPRFSSSSRPPASVGNAAETEEGEESRSENGSMFGGDSTVKATLESYKGALEREDEGEVAEIEALFRAMEDEKSSLEGRVASLHEELQVEKDHLLRMSADFENFRKRTERERVSLVENVKGEVVGELLPVLDNFERAKAQIRTETEGEEKIQYSYQSIYKQFGEILTSLGVVSIETVGCAFDPMLHEAIMREDSTEYGDGIILEEFRMGPGPAELRRVEEEEEEDEEVTKEDDDPEEFLQDGSIKEEDPILAEEFL
ncbi:hypothetical protein HPP92_015869 [Vanilla planifolia]|uniref:GrpE protein homolog n=1 Tax=Vanilla planifolia TaxID=51239 RepID=A0A835QUE5_VANPL|nr:hypothetical protein HPP92_015869 [Vanilla planifolia]